MDKKKIRLVLGFTLGLPVVLGCYFIQCICDALDYIFERQVG